MIVNASQRVCERAGVACRPSSAYVTASPGGPAGSSLYTNFVVFTLKKSIPVGAYTPFNRWNGGTAGWIFYIASNTLFAYATNSTPAFVISAGYLITFNDLNRPLVAIARYNNGTIQLWVNGVSTGAAVTLGTGFTSANNGTAIGGRATNLALEATSPFIVHEAGFLGGYNVVASYNSPVFGAGAEGLSAEWMEDLQQGRYLTMPQSGVGTDYYWSGRDVGGNQYAGPIWTDRISSTAMTRSGSPQMASAAPRF